MNFYPRGALTHILERLQSDEDAPLDNVHEIIGTLPERLDVDNEQDPKIMDTLGSLIDKLITVDLKMWHNQEALYAIRRMSREEFETKYGEDLGSLHETIKRCCDLNVQRATLMDAIDKLFASAIAGRVFADVRPQHKTY